MSRTRAKGAIWREIGPAFLPFADAGTTELPMGRLLRLSLFQVTVGMAVVLMIGTLNRGMIVELGVPAWLVAVMGAVPVVVASGSAGASGTGPPGAWAGGAQPVRAPATSPRRPRHRPGPVTAPARSPPRPGQGVGVSACWARKRSATSPTCANHTPSAASMCCTTRSSRAIRCGLPMIWGCMVST